MDSMTYTLRTPNGILWGTMNSRHNALRLAGIFGLTVFTTLFGQEVAV